MTIPIGGPNYGRSRQPEQKPDITSQWENYFKVSEKYSGERKIWMEFELLNRCMPQAGKKKIALPKNITIEITKESADNGFKITARKLDAGGKELEKTEYLQEFAGADKNNYFVTKQPGGGKTLEKIYYQTDGKKSQVRFADAAQDKKQTAAARQSELKPKTPERPTFARMEHIYENLKYQFSVSLSKVSENLYNSGKMHLEEKLKSIKKWQDEAETLHVNIKESVEYNNTSALRHERAQSMSENLGESMKIMDEKRITVADYIRYKIS